MSTTNPTFSPARVITRVTFVAGLLALGFAFYEWQSMRQVKATLLLAERNYIEDLRRLHALETSTRGLNEQVSKLKRDSDQLMMAFGSQEARGQDTPSDSGKMDPHAAAQQFLARFPQARELLDKVGRATIAKAYGPFFKEAGLNSAQIDQLATATMNAWTQSLAVYPSGGIRPTVIQPPDDQLRAILGDQGFQQYEAYSNTGPEQKVALQIATDAGLAGAPMSSDQGVQLAQIIASASDQNQAGTPVALNSINWEAAMKQAQSLLSPEQYQAAQPTFARMQYQQALENARYSQNGTSRSSP